MRQSTLLFLNMLLENIRSPTQPFFASYLQSLTGLFSQLWIVLVHSVHSSKNQKIHIFMIVMNYKSYFHNLGEIMRWTMDAPDHPGEYLTIDRGKFFVSQGSTRELGLTLLRSRPASANPIHYPE